MPFTNFSYQERNSPVHVLSPAVKLAWAVAVTIITLMADQPVLLILIFISTLLVLRTARVGREWLSFMRLAVFLAVFITIINSFAGSNGATILWRSGFTLPTGGHLNLTLESLVYGFFSGVKLMIIISSFSILTLVLHPDDMLLVLLKARLPYRSAMITTLSTRLVPILITDAERITDAQRSRGLELDKRNVLGKIKSRISILVSLLSGSLERAIQIAESMESRAFGNSSRRTFYHNLEISKPDIAALGLLGLATAFSLYAALNGGSSFAYYPHLSNLLPSPSQWLVIGLVLTGVLAPIPAGYLKRRSGD